MKYKALMVDVDGTSIPYDYHATPSARVTQALKKAQEKVTVCFVTGRAYDSIAEILDQVGMKTGYAVVNGGSLVLDLATKKPLYDMPISKSEADRIISILFEENIEFYLKTDLYKGTSGIGPFQRGEEFENAYMFYAYENYSNEKMEKVFAKISKFSDLSILKTRHTDPQKVGLNITHAKATKLHGIEIIMEKTGIKREEIIGVGDGYNDFPLLMASGLKVAMGNAIPELKEIADYIAPSVDQDGLADVIEKYILQ